MRRAVQRETIARLVALRDAEPVPGRGTVLSTSRYLDEAQLVREQEVLFRGRPVIAAHVSELASVGDVARVDVAGVSLLITRDDASSVHVFMNICPHRGAQLLREPRACGRKAITCPYHSWSYGLDGKLFHVPAEEAFGGVDKSALSLMPVAHEVRHGFIWVKLEGSAPDIGAFLGPEVDDDFAAFGLAEHEVAGQKSRVVPANWKLVMDAFAEGYHLKSLHRQSLARFFSDEATVDDFAPHVRQMGARKALLDAMSSPQTWNVREHTTVFYNVFPNAVLVFHPAWVSLLTLWPVAIDAVRVEHRMLAPAGVDNSDLERSFRLIDQEVFEKEDFMIAASIQSALSSGAKTEMLLGAAEEGMRLFHQARDEAIAEPTTA